MDNNKSKDNTSFSIIVITYNQEQFIELTLQSVFNQNYPSYEVVISDDCSTDNTWGIIKEYVGRLKQNKIDIKLNRNDTNLGIVRNYQKALSLSNGKWLVAMAGDDISKSNRLKELNKLIQYDTEIYAIGTGYDLIDGKNRIINKNINCLQKSINVPLFPGFSAAINRSTFNQFPIIKERLQSEDIIYTLRALELGKILLSNLSTVQHRIHKRNITSKGTSYKSYLGKIENYKNAIKTLEYYTRNELQNNYLLPIIENQIIIFNKNIQSLENITIFYNVNIINKIKWLFLKKEYSIKKKLIIFVESYKITSTFFSLIRKFKFIINGFNRTNFDFLIYDTNGIIKK